jgi:hypothetical protein
MLLVYYPLTLQKISSRTWLVPYLALTRPPSKLRLSIHQDIAYGDSRFHRILYNHQDSAFLPQLLIASLPSEPDLQAFRPPLLPLVSIAGRSVAPSKIISFAFLTIATSAMFSTMTGAVRQFNRRGDPDKVPPISEPGYTEGGWMC